MELDLKQILDLIINNKNRDAINELNKLIDKDDKNINYYHLKGISHLKLAEFSEAKKNFDKLVSLESKFPDVYNNLGVLYFTTGENELAIENFRKAITLKNNFKQAIFGLIKALTHLNKSKLNGLNLISKHNEINKIDIDYSPNKYIEDSEIKDFFDKANQKIGDEFKNFEYTSTQIYRRDSTILNCKRHKKVFNIYDVIPKFCFGCYKVQIEPEKILDLIKLYILFDKISLNNIRKCMIELRPNVAGKYKGLIYCDSVEEAIKIQEQLNRLIEKNFNKKLSSTIKRGCTEYGVKYPEYNKIDNNPMEHKSDWSKYEKLVDEKFPNLAFNEKLRPTIKGISLHDILVIKNWLAYASLTGDQSHTLVSDQIFKSNFIEKKINFKNA